MTLRESLIKSLRDGHTTFIKSMGDFPEDKLTFQIAPTDNHVLWTAGHMMTTYAWWTKFLTTETTEQIPTNLAEMYDGKKKPTSDASAYPSLQTVIEALNTQYEIFIKAVEHLPESEYYTAPAMDSGGFLTYKIDVLLIQINHIGWHTGQISSLRRALGLPSLFGMF